MSERRVADIDVLTITLEIASTRALFLLLARDGTVNRMGSGSPSTADGDLYIGQTQPALLPEALKGLSEEALGHTGVYDIPKKLGVPCRLAIALRFADGSEDGFGYTYGSDSQGPPKPIAMFVHASVMATQSWYQEQRTMVGKGAAPNLLPPQPGRTPWWRVW